MNRKVKKQTIIIEGTTFGVLATAGAIAGIVFGIRHINGDFETEKSQIWEIVKETPKDTAHVVLLTDLLVHLLLKSIYLKVLKVNFRLILFVVIWLQVVQKMSKNVLLNIIKSFHTII
ncbi:hypothetical protein [Spiroplasma phoeniceum]|uniref:Transmembrane protein n=1 Tax=Spiroplasma phoeniceum P40 TaxID=1276259 RepID=A0A345DRU1_9MOLU|nr:hypothetical protein [Spiroplasma phoeniceum]AXF96932.1 hypothetical protein SDAV_001992 [Spiroplasma phoeniceum P40]